MSISKQIAPHIPYLRRYARALTGSQASGDRYVLTVLESLVASPEAFDSTQDAKVALYKIFSRIWNSFRVNGESDLPESIDDMGVARNLEAITPRARQAFLLSTVEGFSFDEVAQILDLEESQVGTLIDEAGRDIADQVATDVLVIEDEPIIAMDLENLVESLGHRVAGTARTRTEAVEIALAKRPGLILADIQLGDGSSGIDAVNDIISAFDVPVIFITAYPERLLTGERPEPAFLITKPFQSDMVKAVVSQALFFDTRAGGSRMAASG